MPIGINTNLNSMLIQSQLTQNKTSLRNNIQQLSTGLRINSAADDAAGLAVSEGLKSDVRSLNQATRNASDAMSAAQTAEGGMKQAQDILGRMKELSTRANSAALNDQQRQSLDEEFQQLGEELQDVSEDTEFNGQKLLDGSFEGSFQVGEDAGDSLNLSVSQNFDNSFLGKNFEVTTANVSGQALSFGASATAQQFTEGESFTIQGSDGDTKQDFEVTNVSGQKVQFSGSTEGHGFTAGENLDITGGVGPASLDSQAAASFASGAVDQALDQVSNARSKVGATQNRFETRINNISQEKQGLQAANSRIRDADIAQQAAALTQNNILNQSATAMLTQANSMPDMALNLLNGQ